MDLKILLPYKIYADIKNVDRIVAETNEGSFGLLPQRLDCVASLIPGILLYETDKGEIHYIAIDEGILVKAGTEVLVSVRNAIGGTDIGQLHNSIKKEYVKLDDNERSVRSVMAKIESEIIYNLQKFNKR
jgi:F-type H+-transporting ATPase subunit epsilon